MSSPSPDIHMSAHPLPKGVHLTNDLAVLMATAMALGTYYLDKYLESLIQH